MKLVGSGTLEISDLRLEDQGTYTCEAKNSSGLETSRESAMLIVEDLKSTESTPRQYVRLSLEKIIKLRTQHIFS